MKKYFIRDEATNELKELEPRDWFESIDFNINEALYYEELTRSQELRIRREVFESQYKKWDFEETINGFTYFIMIQ